MYAYKAIGPGDCSGQIKVHSTPDISIFNSMNNVLKKGRGMRRLSTLTHQLVLKKRSKHQAFG